MPDILADLQVPGIPGADPIQVEPNDQTGSVEGALQGPHCGEIFSRIADENGPLRHVHGQRNPARRFGIVYTPEALPALLRQRLDESLSTGVKNLRARAEIGKKCDEARIFAAPIIGEDLNDFSRIRQTPTLCRTQKYASDPVGEITADDQ